VTGVVHQGLRRDADTVLSLLALAWEPAVLAVVFMVVLLRGEAVSFASESIMPISLALGKFRFVDCRKKFYRRFFVVRPNLDLD
jgi:hypothetical protein